MKANEAPEKLYLHPTAKGEVGASWLAFPLTNEDIEYTRADAFIEKALKWYCLDCECNDNCKDTKCFFYRQYERYLKGVENCLPPKFSDVILNEDGSTSDNWRHRHFIRKMKDVFIEKACAWFKEHAEDYDYTWYNEFLGESGITDKCIKDFKNYMKGE